MNILWAFVLTINLGGHTLTQKYWNMTSLQACNTVRMAVEQRWEPVIHASVGECVDQATLQESVSVDAIVSSPKLDEGK